jgi:serine/threonine protein kinase
MSDDDQSSADPFGQIADEFVEALRQGKRPSVEEFARRYPAHADEIREVLPALVLMEKAKAPDHTSGEGASPAAAPPLSQLGDYQILREVGRGGMGMVYEARQLSLGRHVAIKVLPGHALLDPRQLGRFQREARAAAKLHHTNIVPVFGVGEQDGLHYYVMQFIPGLGLDAVLDELRRLRQPPGKSAPTQAGAPGGPTHGTRDVSAVAVARGMLSGVFRQPDPASALTPPAAEPAPGADPAAPSAVRAADTSSAVHLPGQSGGSSLSESGRQYWQSVARVGMQVADALAHAASQGVLHRDIKPSNLLLDDTGNVWVTDFGLAKADSDRDNLTHTGDIVGTLRYMAPERFNGQGDLRSDVYSLGLTLYELLALRPAFDETDRHKLVQQVMRDEPVRPRKLNPGVPRDLETVVLKAIARDPAHRYQTPAAMAEDLKRFVEDRPVKARRASEAEKLWRWGRRNPGIAVLGGALAAVLVLVTVASLLAAGYFNRLRLNEAQAAQSERDAWHEAELSRQAAEKAAEERRDAQRRAALERTTVTAMSGKFPEAEQALDEAVALGASEPEIHLRRGQIALYEGRTKDALVHLEKAAQALPDSVAARAVLAWAYYDAGQSDRFYLELANVGAGTPVTAEDHLFLGQATARFHPAEALPLLNRAIERRDSALARLIRADVRTKFAGMTGLPEDAEQALGDVHVAQALLPGNRAALTASLEAHLTAACAYERHQQPAKRKTALERAERDAAALKALPSLPRRSQDARLRYLDYVGDEEAIRAEYVREKPSTGGAIAGRWYFLQLYRQGKFAEALEVAEQMPRTGSELSYRMRRAFVLAQLPDGPALALKEFQAAKKAWPGGPRGRRGEFYPPTILLFLGRKEEAAALYRDMAEAGVHSPLDRTRWYQKACEHFAGMRSAEELLAGAGGSQWFLCEGHFFIGLRLLAEGDRAGARRHFEDSVATRVLHYMEYDWSRAFLARLENDRTWPPWIPIRK